ncbi:MAG: sigma-70 family RNA polymerase sigma factor [Gammaproteobacteria bacterium]|nr:sigma-70 family RNA polymerase sigma factor [Gammaproteobacteria bacterium]
MSNKQIRYEALVRAFHADLYRYAFWLTKQRTVAEDLVQETFLRAWKNLDSLQDAAAAKGWLITILRRENARRFERKQFDYQDIDQDWLEDEHTAGPEQHAENHQLHQHIANLSEEYREPLVLQVLFGMTGEEIAQTLELNLNTVNTRLFRARHQLREQLSQSPNTGASQHG